MKRIIIPLYSKIAFIVSALMALLHLLIKISETQNLYFFIFKCEAQEFLVSIDFVCVIALISAVAVVIFKNITRKEIKTLTGILTVAVSVMAFLFFSATAMFSIDNTFFEYTSLDGEHEIVVKESSWLLMGGGSVYEKTSFCTMKRIGGYSTDDGYRPFSNKEFYFVWNENNFELHYCNGRGEYTTAVVEYVK